MSVELWVEKYRPKTLDSYVWRDPSMRAKAEEWIAEGAIPNCLFAGVAGTGKTSLAFLLLREMNIPNGDILYINASRERRVEDIQEKIGGFVTTWALGPSNIKYIICDEFDAVTPTAQKMLRAELEQYHDMTRFIATCNYINKIIPALISRFHVVHFQTLSFDDCLVRAGEILSKENIEIDYEILESYVRITHPDMRKCISLLQHNIIGGKLTPPNDTDQAAKDYLLNIIPLFKKGKITEARKLIIEQAQPEEYPDLYRFLYRNLDLFGNTQEKQDDALLIIRKAVVHHEMVADKEINLAACLAELTRI